MKRVITLLIIILLSGYLPAQKTFLKWEKIKSPEFLSPEIVYGDSANDFWIMDLNAILYHYKNNTWKKYPLIKSKSYSRFRYKYISNSKIILSAVDSVWNSHIFLFENGCWRKQGIIKNAVMNILYTSDGRLFFAGDWGTLVEYKKGKLVNIKTPFRNHIIASNVIGNMIWMGVRGEGIFSFDGSGFTKYDIEGGSKLEYAYVFPYGKDSMRFVTGNGNQYVLKYKKFYKTNKHYEFGVNPIKEIALSHYKIMPDYLPFSKDEVFVSSNYKYRQHFQFKDGRILLLTQNNDLMLSVATDHNYFVDCSSLYGLKGYENVSDYGACFFYCDDNMSPDLFICNEFSEIYLNRNGSHFVNTVNSTTIPKPTGVTRFDFADISNNGKVDFINTELTTEGPVVNIYEQTDDLIFENSERITSKNLLAQRAFENIRPLDFNADGRIDLDVSLYLDQNIKAGNQILAFSSGLGAFDGFDTSFTKLTRGWNFQSIYADFNNDGLNDWFILSGWKPLKLLFQLQSRSPKFTTFNFPGDTLTVYIGGFAFDYNNDGFLDVAVTSDKKLVSVYKNIGGKYFEEVTDSLGLSRLNKNVYSRLVWRSMNCGDFNNDGYLDVFLSLDDPGNSRNFLFINKNGKEFIEVSHEFNVNQPFVNGTAIADIDLDGDLDLFAFKRGYNVLWINNLNDNNYLIVIPKGVKSNTDGIGAKVKVYVSGHLGDEKYLRGFRQIGSDQYGYNKINQRFAHFGLIAGELYDVEVKFYGGATKILKRVSAGRTIVVKEFEGMMAMLYTFPISALHFINNHSNQYYFIIIIASLVFLFVGSKYGVSKFKWNYSTTISIVVVNLSLFWLMLFLTRSSFSNLVKYYLPLMVMAGGVFLPLFIFRTLKRIGFQSKTKSELEENLLTELLQFIHGEWALRNISGLLLLFQNYTSEETRKEKYYELINERTKTFSDLTKPILTRIVDLSSELNIAHGKANMLKDDLINVDKIISGKSFAGLEEAKISELASLFAKIKYHIKEIKESVFRFFSCVPENVIKEITLEYEDVAIAKGIELKKLKNYDDKIFALIKTDDLAVVLDNCIQNSIRAVGDSVNPQIEILLKWEAPRIIIEVNDNGIGISDDKREKIFEHGFSENKSTGIGLAASKKIIEKYNGKIYVKESIANKNTSIAIELNEGVR